MTMQGLGVAYQGSAMSLIMTAESDGNAHVVNRKYRSAMSQILAVAAVMAMQVWRMAKIDKLCH